jgi:alpha-L-fucosidase
MLADVEDLKSTLDEAAHQLSDTVLEIEDWEPWLVYFLEDLEMLAASLDARHPNGYRALLEQLKDDIENKLQKETWRNRIYLAPPIIRDYWS